jgi:hypothetical protein
MSDWQILHQMKRIVHQGSTVTLTFTSYLAQDAKAARRLSKEKWLSHAELNGMSATSSAPNVVMYVSSIIYSICP